MKQLILILLALASPAAGQQIKLQSGQTWPGVSIVDAPGRNGAVLLYGTVEGATIGPAVVRDAYRVVETYSDKTTVKGLTIDGLVGENIRREGIRIRGVASDITIRNTVLKHSATPNVSPDLPEGIHLETGANVLIENVHASGFQMAMEPGTYWNGDGLAAESAVKGLVIRNSGFVDNTDAGLDLKVFTVLDNVFLSGNARNLRLWRGGEATTLTFGPTVKRGGAASTAMIWMKGNSLSPPVLTIEKLVVKSDKPETIFRVEDGPADIRIGSCVLDLPAGSVLKVAGNKAMKWTLGPGCGL